MGHLRPSRLQSVLYLLVAAGEKVDMTHAVNSMPPQNTHAQQQQQQRNKQKNAGILSTEKHHVAWLLNTTKNLNFAWWCFLVALSCLCNQ